MENKQRVVKKQMTFPTALADTLEGRAKKYGFTFPEYVRHLLLQSVELDDSSEVEYLDPATEALVAESMKQYERGEYITLRTTKEIEDFFLNRSKSRKGRK